MEVSRAFKEVVISSRRTSGGFASFGLPVYVPSGGGIGGGVDIEIDGSCMYVIGGCDNIMESNQSDLTGVRVMSSLKAIDLLLLRQRADKEPTPANPW